MPEASVFAVDTVECLGGSLPRAQQRLVEAWAEIHRAELQLERARRVRFTGPGLGGSGESELTGNTQLSSPAPVRCPS